VTLALLVLATVPCVQAGDKQGEEQTPLPPELVVPPAPALSPEEALESFVLRPGFRIELVAAEPLVVDPVAMAWGADGSLWVVEMRGFMPTIDGEGELDPVGAIAVLAIRTATGAWTSARPSWTGSCCRAAWRRRAAARW
jgi:hypothetical protein